MPELVELTWRGGTCHQTASKGEEMMSEEPTNLCYLKVNNVFNSFFSCSHRRERKQPPKKTSFSKSIKQ